jgi:chaperonin GroEL
VLEYEKGNPKITKDGVTVAKNCMLKDRGEEIGSYLIRGVSNSLNNLAGDGTTTATLLTTAIIKEGLKYT